MVKPLKKFNIYFDESAKDGVYVFTAAVVEESKKRALERRLLAIRREMTYEVLRVAPHLREHPKLTDGKLLEIHAVDLYQSGGIFREVKKVVPDFWHKQHKWLSQALEAARGYRTQYFFFTYNALLLQQSFADLGYASDALAGFRFQSVKDKLNSIFANPYFSALIILMQQLDDFLVSQNAEGQIYCHTYDGAHAYSTISFYEVARQRGHFTTLTQPVFRTCTEEQGIQCADAAGYLFLQTLYANYHGTDLKPVFVEWGQRYLVGDMHSPQLPASDERDNIVGLIIFEMFTSNPGGPHGFQVAVRQLMAKHLRDQGGTREPDIRAFLDEALKVYDQTNKPPSGDGDLYGQTVPEETKEGKDEDADSNGGQP